MIEVKIKYGYYTEEEDKFIQNSYLTMSDGEIGRALGRTEGGAKGRRQKLGLRSPNAFDNKLSKDKRIAISIDELKKIAHKLNRHPYKHEYESYRVNGYSMCPLLKYTGLRYKQICDKYLPEYIVPEGYKKCYSCKRIKPIIEFNTSQNSNGVTANCRVCGYIERNGLKIPNGWAHKEIVSIIDNILNEKIRCINELCNIISNKTIDDFADLLSSKLIIGNKPMDIKLNCADCGKIIYKPISVYLINQNSFCSLECYWKHKAKNAPRVRKAFFIIGLLLTVPIVEKRLMLFPLIIREKIKMVTGIIFVVKNVIGNIGRYIMLAKIVHSMV